VTSQVLICNQALLLLGDKPIQSLDEDTNEALMSSAFYIDARNHVLRDIKPRFAIARAVPVDVTVPVPDPYLVYSYAMPTNALVMLQVGGDSLDIEWVVEGVTLLSSGPLSMFRYIAALTDIESLMDASFIKALAAYLAQEFSYGLTGKETRGPEMAKLYELRKGAAENTYGMESSTVMTANVQLQAVR
jgi:hypothetical protein